MTDHIEPKNAPLFVDTMPISRYVSCLSTASFDKARTSMIENGYRVISLEENAILRMETEKHYAVSRLDSNVREGLLFVPERGLYITKKSPFFQDFPIELNFCNNTRPDWDDRSAPSNSRIITKDQIEEALSDSISIPGKDVFVPANRFAEDEYAIYLFGETAGEYRDFLSSRGVEGLFFSGKDLLDSTEPFVQRIYSRIGVQTVPDPNNPPDRMSICVQVLDFDGYGVLTRGVKDLSDVIMEDGSIRIQQEPYKETRYYAPETF